MKEGPIENESKNNEGKYVIVALTIVAALWLSSWFFLLIKDPINRGTIGDMFGAVNALFSGMAFAGIVITLLLQRNDLALQREDLALQREELKLTRDELKRTADAQEESEKALRRQAENLKISAKLSALNTLVNYYSNELERLGKLSPTYHQNINKRKIYLNRIEDILERKEIDVQ